MADSAGKVLPCGPDVVVVESEATAAVPGLCHAHTVNHARQLAALRWAKAPESDRERLRTLRSKPTACKKCGKLQPSARQARAHCKK